MVANAPDTPTQAEVIFIIEATAANGAYISELKTNYIVPTLEYFHGGALEEGGGSGSVYSIVAYKAADCHPGLPVSTYGPFTCPQTVLETVDKIQYIGGHAESRACVTEALTTALACFDELGRTDIPLHILMLCCSPPYSAYAGGLVPPGAPGTVEQAARLVGERGVQVSIACARRVPALHALYEHAGGELVHATQRNYAKDPRHLVLLRGYSLKERPPSPAPPPVPEIQGDVYPQARPGNPAARPPAPLFPRQPGVRPAWPAAARQPIYANNSALLTQLAQPSYPPPPPQQGHQRMGGILSPGPSTSPAGPAAAAPQRSFIWSGVLEWMEKGKAPGDQQKTTRHLACQVSAGSKEVEPELKVDTWPNKLLMQLMPKQLISNIGGQYLKDSKSVLFHLQPSDALDALTKVMVNGFAGCVHFSLMSSPPQCDIKVLILLYTPDKKAYLGFIPNNQATFVDRLRKVIQQQKITQIINKQLPPGAAGGSGGMPQGSAPTSSMAASGGQPSGMAGNSMPGTSGMGSMQQQPMPQQMQPAQGLLQHQQHQGMMIGGGMGGQVPQIGGKGPRPVTQMDGLEAARRENLEKIQQLQQSLEAAHQQQYKSQMDIMSHLQAAQQQEQHYRQLEVSQQQEQHYRQLEEQRKHQAMQQQLQQQLRAGAGPHAPRIMRPLLPANNPGLRHLLQQTPQFRPGGGAVRPAQTQQFDDVPNYNDFL